MFPLEGGDDPSAALLEMLTDGEKQWLTIDKKAAEGVEGWAEEVDENEEEGVAGSPAGPERTAAIEASGIERPDWAKVATRLNDQASTIGDTPYLEVMAPLLVDKAPAVTEIPIKQTASATFSPLLFV